MPPLINKLRPPVKKPQLLASDFEVSGEVINVHFGAHTKEQADKLGIRGWCRSTAQGTVLGQVEGPPEKVESMINWLKTTGSPKSKIENVVLKNQKEITDFSFTDFGIIRERD